MHLLDLRTTRYVSQYDMMIYKPLYTQFSTLTYTISSFLKTYISIYTLSTMDMYILNVDEGDLMRIHEPGFSATKRILDSEAKINKAIFHLKDAEMMASETFNKSSLVTGGAGTGKTELLIQKIAAEDPTKRVLVVSRLPDLVKKIRQDVEAKRSSECTSFMVYDDLRKNLPRKSSRVKVCPSEILFHTTVFALTVTNHLVYHYHASSLVELCNPEKMATSLTARMAKFLVHLQAAT